MTRFRVRPKTVREYVRKLHQCSMIQVMAGEGLFDVFAKDCREAFPLPAMSIGRKARQCVEYDRKCRRAALRRARQQATKATITATGQQNATLRRNGGTGCDTDRLDK